MDGSASRVLSQMSWTDVASPRYSPMIWNSVSLWAVRRRPLSLSFCMNASIVPPPAPSFIQYALRK